MSNDQNEMLMTLRHEHDALLEERDQLKELLSQGEKSVSSRLLKWLPPGITRETHASWLELFYDLIFVVAVSQPSPDNDATNAARASSRARSSSN